jgi:hypothetical protein
LLTRSAIRRPITWRPASNQQVGALVGAVLLGALGAVASYKTGVNVTNSAVQTGASVGGAVGRISYSK